MTAKITDWRFFIVRNQKDWIEMYKSACFLRSDYALAKKWQMHTGKLARIKNGRLRLPLKYQLMIAEELEIEPLEIIVSIECEKKNISNDEILKHHYFGALIKSIGTRMSVQSRTYWRNFP